MSGCFFLKHGVYYCYYYYQSQLHLILVHSEFFIMLVCVVLIIKLKSSDFTYYRYIILLFNYLFSICVLMVFHNVTFLIVTPFRTERECDRRQTMMDHLVTRQKQLELTFEHRDQRSIQRYVLSMDVM